VNWIWASWRGRPSRAVDTGHEAFRVIDAAIAPDLAFPHDLLASEIIEGFTLAGPASGLDNHRVRRP
jgi:hypothetical protein